MNSSRRGYRESRERTIKQRIPELGYYFIVTDTEETETNYLIGLKNSIPKYLQDKLVIKVCKTDTKKLVREALDMASLHPQFGEIWIVFDKDQVKDFDKIIEEAEANDIKVGWTNPCLEEWFHAYFGKMPYAKDSVQCCYNFSSEFEKITGQKYHKNDRDIYSKLNKYGNEEKAIKIAESKLNEQIRNGNIVPSTMNPATTVHRLIKEIKMKSK